VGVITFEVTGGGLFRAAGDGALLGTTTFEDLHREGHVAAPTDEAVSPDGLSFASIVRMPEGVFLATSVRGETRTLAQLAGPSDPALVAGGKGHARAVEGVPVVVAWSPDSSQIAYGSITGVPYTLTIAGALHLASPARHFVEVAGGYVGEVAWSPDGRQIAVSTYSLDRLDHTVLIVDARSGAVRRLIDGCHVTWSPDSQYVAVHRDPGAETGAWVVSVGNPLERWPISTEAGAFPLTWREG
jgi:WD40 repeat protein